MCERIRVVYIYPKRVNLDVNYKLSGKGERVQDKMYIVISLFTFNSLSK